MSWLFGPIAVIAGLSWLAAVYSGARITALSRPGARFSTIQRLGRWDFGGLRAEIGPGIDPYVRTYQFAFLGFFLCMLGILAAGFFLAAESDPRVSSLASATPP